MKDLIVSVSKETQIVDLSRNIIGNDNDNLQSNLIFEFTDKFVDGQARLEFEIDGKKNYIPLKKVNNTYTLPIKNILTKQGQINMQLVITESEVDEGIPVFHSNKFYLYCKESINAVDEAPQGYELWIEQANDKLNQIDNLDIDINKGDKKTIITLHKKDGTVKNVEILDGQQGEQGEKGADAKINGYNTLDIVAGNNIEIKQVENQMTINNTIDTMQFALIGEAGNRIQIELDEETYKIVAKLYDKNDNLISTSQAIDLPLESVVVNGRYDSFAKVVVLTLQNGNDIRFSVADLIEGLQSEINFNNKLDADLVEDTNSKNKFTTVEEKDAWNNKQDQIAFNTEYNENTNKAATMEDLKNVSSIPIFYFNEEDYNSESNKQVMIDTHELWLEGKPFIITSQNGVATCRYDESFNRIDIVNDWYAGYDTDYGVRGYLVTINQYSYRLDLSSLMKVEKHTIYLRVLNQTVKLLSTDNTKEYVPSDDYNPATKKFVEETVANAVTGALGGEY